jgi:hypothetical protein
LNPLRRKVYRPLALLILACVLILFLVVGFQANRWLGTQGARTSHVLAWLHDPTAHPEWAVKAGERCGQALFLVPTDGFIGFLWGDSFRPGHRHQGLDIFGGKGVNQAPVIAAYPGYLTRLEDWKSTVIIRIPDDPLHPGRQSGPITRYGRFGELHISRVSTRHVEVFVKQALCWLQAPPVIHST